MEGPDHIDPENTAAVRLHRQNVQTAEGVRQSAVAAAGNNQTAVTAAQITYLRSCLASAKTAGNAALAGFYQSALKEQGVNT
jgi:hypothetical protein